MISNSFTLIIIIGVQLIKIIYLSIHLVPDTILSYSNHSYKKCISSWVFFLIISPSQLYATLPKIPTQNTAIVQIQLLDSVVSNS